MDILLYPFLSFILWEKLQYAWMAQAALNIPQITSPLYSPCLLQTHDSFYRPQSVGCTRSWQDRSNVRRGRLNSKGIYVAFGVCVQRKCM